MAAEYIITIERADKESQRPLYLRVKTLENENLAIRLIDEALSRASAAPRKKRRDAGKPRNQEPELAIK